MYTAAEVLDAFFADEDSEFDPDEDEESEISEKTSDSIENDAGEQQHVEIGDPQPSTSTGVRSNRPKRMKTGRGRYDDFVQLPSSESEIDGFLT